MTGFFRGRGIPISESCLHAGVKERPALFACKSPIRGQLLAVSPFGFISCPIGFCSIPLLGRPMLDLGQLGRLGSLRDRRLRERDTGADEKRGSNKYNCSHDILQTADGEPIT